MSALSISPGCDATTRDFIPNLVSPSLRLTSSCRRVVAGRVCRSIGRCDAWRGCAATRNVSDDQSHRNKRVRARGRRGKGEGTGGADG